MTRGSDLLRLASAAALATLSFVGAAVTNELNVNGDPGLCVLAASLYAVAACFCCRLAAVGTVGFVAAKDWPVFTPVLAAAALPVYFLATAGRLDFGPLYASLLLATFASLTFGRFQVRRRLLLEIDARSAERERRLAALRKRFASGLETKMSDSDWLAIASAANDMVEEAKSDLKSLGVKH